MPRHACRGRPTPADPEADDQRDYRRPAGLRGQRRKPGPPLVYKKEAGELVCKGDRLAFPVRDDIPVMLESDARELAADEDA